MRLGSSAFRFLLALATLVIVVSPARAATVNVNVTNFMFTPKNPTIQPGDTIHWQLVAGTHTTTSGTPGSPDGQWQSDIDSGTPTFNRVFSTPGVYPYYCEIHGAAMTGSIIVGNQPPVVANPGTRNGSEGTAFTVTVTATDLNNDALTMSDQGTHPGWSTFTDLGNRSCRIQGTPGFSDANTYPVTVRATDPGGLFHEVNFNIVIANVNTAPAVTNPGTQNGTQGTFFTVTVSATDPQNDALTLSDLGTHPAWSTFTDNGDRTCTFQGTPPSAGTFPVSVRATDPGALADTDTFSIVIAAATGIGDDVVTGSVHGLTASPNPFHGTVDLVFRLADAQEVTVEVFDLGGHRVRRLEAGTLPAGDHVVRWDGRDGAGRDAAAGVYLVRVQAAQGLSVSKVWKTR